ncbi:AAA family ATPase [Methylobacterium sp. E-045]|uniref:AAA family ATPase n=1 Tax=Methylobacterium sp. E-045 TaxID=2836575 RepID=UPI001FBAB1E8|nr:ATP-binding protein [Methylobacterium sp. E-045]MCJ2131576.1 ATP-binding protein [Methylobacterium sp. E-045]
MLLALRIRNFLSFRDEAEISLIAHKADKTLRSSLIKAKVAARKTVDLLPVVAIYGANSSGKTNLLKSVDYLRSAVLHSQSKWEPDGGTRVRPFGDKHGRNDLTSIEVEFILEDVRYVYGIVAHPGFFAEEWLKSFPLGRERPLFQRISSVSPDFYKLKPGSEIEGQIKVNASEHFTKDLEYLDGAVTRCRQNSLFLSVAAQDNHPICLKIYQWFRSIQVDNISISTDRSFAMSAAELIASDPQSKSSILTVMKAADPNLVDIRVQKSDVSSSPPDFLEDVGARFRERYFRDFRYKVHFTVLDGSKKLNLPLEAQSRGFQKLFALSARVMSALRKGGLFVVDELESSIHPHLARFIVDLFQNPEVNVGKSQLIFTTHDTNMLDQSLLRRDQVWFVEKDKCCSELYSLLEFSPRKDENLEKGYLRGRYGAIPALGLSANWLGSQNIQHELEPLPNDEEQALDG